MREGGFGQRNPRIKIRPSNLRDLGDLVPSSRILGIQVPKSLHRPLLIIGRHSTPYGLLYCRGITSSGLGTPAAFKKIFTIRAEASWRKPKSLKRRHAYQVVIQRSVEANMCFNITKNYILSMLAWNTYIHRAKVLAKHLSSGVEDFKRLANGRSELKFKSNQAPE